MNAMRRKDDKKREGKKRELYCILGNFRAQGVTEKKKKEKVPGIDRSLTSGAVGGEEQMVAKKTSKNRRFS